ncbi:MAG TPA: adenylate/guanylate cyclase domain-containing protein [Stellaceae bacterium]|nr:adenylate/guanylate cyclase domain-containing protein [Stellaceae bacterium]
MGSERVQRRLAAILAADVAGYSRLMGADEEGTIARLKALRRELIDPTIASHGGRIVKTTGDGILIEFVSVVDAVRCGVEVQRGMASRNGDVAQDKRIEFRVGINLGDVVVEGDDLLGDGVNVAARLESIAEPGAICLSADVYRQIQGKITIAADDLGEQQLKNIAQPVRVYQLSASERARKASPPLALPDKPSIAVLPFHNMSGDPEQEYFADGIVEDIITALSRFRQLFVIARNSTFTYKGRAVDVKQVGRELGVRYVLEGSVRRAADRVRITGQLIDATNGAHLWADRFDGALEDVFDLQDRITTRVVGAIASKLERAEIERALRKPTESLVAYDCHLRGLACVYGVPSQRSTEDALHLFNKAIELDPNFAAAYGWAAVNYSVRKQNGWMADPQGETTECLRLARRGAELAGDDPVALATSGFALAYIGGELEAGAMLVDRALSICPNWALAWHTSGWVRTYLGEHEKAVEQQDYAMRLSPLGPQAGQMATAAALSCLCAGRFEEAAFRSERVLMEQPNFLPALRTLAASTAFLGRLKEARNAISRMLEISPQARVGDTRRRIPFRRAEDADRFEQGLRRAGLPE